MPHQRHTPFFRNSSYFLICLTIQIIAHEPITPLTIPPIRPDAESPIRPKRSPPTTPPTIHPQAFNGNAPGRKIYVPRSSVEAYKSATGWSMYAKDIEGYDF